MQQKLNQLATSISEDLHVIDHKEIEINDQFRVQIEEYGKAKARLKSLEETKEVQTKKSEELSKTLHELTEKLASVRAKVDKKGNGITDTTPLVEIRTALQRIRAENKELDIRIGILVSSDTSQDFSHFIQVYLTELVFAL